MRHVPLVTDTLATLSRAPWPAHVWEKVVARAGSPVEATHTPPGALPSPTGVPGPLCHERAPSALRPRKKVGSRACPRNRGSRGSGEFTRSFHLPGRARGNHSEGSPDDLGEGSPDDLGADSVTDFCHANSYGLRARVDCAAHKFVSSPCLRMGYARGGPSKLWTNFSTAPVYGLRARGTF
jgi:hypothetical protein